ncbi:MAG: transketolase [Magnetococcales bacterium]|nr:transketolase [Magnetococcales bacterium]
MDPGPITGTALRRIILEKSFQAQVGHIGSALSVADIMAALFGDVLHIPHPRDPERDRFVLAKGHASLALYAALYLKGWMARATLDSFRADGSPLGTHPEAVLPGVDFATGSLGHGLSMAVGAALAARLQGSPRRVHALLSDAECNEGSVWEAAQFAAHHRLDHLTAIIDCNGMQAMGPTRDILNMDLPQRWAAFGWRVRDVDGHDREALTQALSAIDGRDHRPLAVVARTVQGKGVSFMENVLKWHYWPMNAEQFRQAMADIGAPVTP